MVTFLFVLVLLNKAILGFPFYLPMQSESECKGTSNIEEVDLQVRWDIANIYNPNGWDIPAGGLLPKTKYRATVCGAIANDIKSCDGERSWCLEVTNITSDECIQGLSNWDSNSIITYYAITDSLDKYPQIMGIRVQVNDSDEIYDKNCSSGSSTVNYDIICRVNETVAYSIYQDIENCYYTVNIYSEYGCVDYKPIPQQLVPYLINMDPAKTCKGKTSIDPLEIDEIEWDLGFLGNPNGFEKPDYIFGEEPNRMYRLSLCQGMKDNASICTAERDLCLEIASINRSCIQPLAAWDDDSVLFTYALFNSSNPDKAGLVGLRILLEDDSMSDNPDECGSNNKPVRINYELVCIDDPDDDTILIPSITANQTLCQYNVTIMSKWSCARIVSGGKKDNIIEDMSAGSILLVIVSITFIVYVIIGCGYNGVVHGRVGLDAMPNKRMWHQCMRYTIAGCITTKDTCCFCGTLPTTYQEL